MEDRKPMIISESEIGKYVFENLIRYHGFCIDKNLEEAIAESVFDFLEEKGIIGDVEYED